VPLIMTRHIAAYINQQSLTAEMFMQIMTVLCSKAELKQ